MSVNSRLTAIYIIGQRKAFYRQIIPESSCARKETVDKYILESSWNGDRKIINILEWRQKNCKIYQIYRARKRSVRYTKKRAPKINSNASFTKIL